MMDRPQIASAWNQYGFSVATPAKRREHTEEKARQYELRQKIEDIEAEKALKSELDLFYGVDL